MLRDLRKRQNKLTDNYTVDLFSEILTNKFILFIGKCGGGVAFVVQKNLVNSSYLGEIKILRTSPCGSLWTDEQMALNAGSHGRPGESIM